MNFQKNFCYPNPDLEIFLRERLLLPTQQPRFNDSLLQMCLFFWSRSAMLERDIRIANVTVKQKESRRDTSARPLHAGIDSKQMTVGLLRFHRWLTQNSSFLIQTFMQYVPGEPTCEGFKRDGVCKKARDGDFRPLNHYISETTEDRPI